MTTLQTAGDVLVLVAQTYVRAQPGELYQIVDFNSRYALDTYDQPSCSIYEITGPSIQQGVGTVKQWRHTQFRCDVRGGLYQDVRQIIEYCRTAWINDFNVVNGNGTVGNGYLRANGIKWLELSEMRSAPLDKREFFRRLLDVTVEIGD